MAKCLVAVGTLVGSCGAVGRLVLLKVRLLTKLLLTYAALERSLTYKNDSQTLY